MRVSTKHPHSFLSEGSAELGGVSIPYQAVCEEWLLVDEAENAEASVFSYSYFRKDGEENRPVLFAFNGGPGSGCLWLHLGLTGPTRLCLDHPLDPSPTPPYTLEPNPHCPLDVCDVVMIDPVGTGYAQLFSPEAADRYYSADGDAAAIAAFIEAWLNRYGRWQSPKYLMGESYGTIRSCLLLRELAGGPTTTIGRCCSISIDGLILMGSVGLNGSKAEPVEPSVLYLTSYATAHWYHHLGKGKSVDPAFLEEAFRFSYEEYLPALYLGTRLPQDKRDMVVRKLEKFTGVDAAWLLQHDLRITPAEFTKVCFQQESVTLGLYDTRYTACHSNCLGVDDPIADDAAMGKYAPAFVTAMNGSKKAELGISWEKAYRAISFSEVNRQFQMQGKNTPLQCLAGAMRRNSKLRLLFVGGLYDLCTPMGYVQYICAQGKLPEERVMQKVYESGHMPYLDEPAATALAADIREFIKQ